MPSYCHDAFLGFIQRSQNVLLLPDWCLHCTIPRLESLVGSCCCCGLTWTCVGVARFGPCCLLMSNSIALPPTQPKHPPPKRMHGFQQWVRGALCNVPPSHRDAYARLSFTQRPPRRFKPRPRTAPSATEPLRQVQSHGANGAPKLRREITVPSVHGFNHWPRQFDDFK